ncbi:MAG: DNA polymerase Y family protein [Myxococcales bacterium]|nr:MAG: DNA polymerase Y family protein [Myxococcales bacterium]
MFGGSPNPQKRRVLALILPDLLVELALRQRLAQAPPEQLAEAHRPLGVVVVSEVGRPAPQQLSLSVGGQPLAEEPELPASEPLAAVNREAERFGVRAKQTIAEASALVAQLIVVKVKRAEVERALGGLAEVALGYGATVAIASPDTVWVDITGSAHLFGGEEALAQDLAERVRELGHRVKIAVSAGPELARAFARWSAPWSKSGASGAVTLIEPSRAQSAAEELPIHALPLNADDLGYFTRLGLLTLGDLARQPRSALGPRLGKDAARILSLCEGLDDTPLVPYEPPRVLEEESTWEDAVSGTEPLGFVLRGLAARLSARLCARGEAAELLDVTLQYDSTIARFRGVAPHTVLHFKLSQPLHREADLRRIVASRLERLKLEAPSVGMKLTVPRLTPIVQRQLSLSELLVGDTARGEEELPLVLAELTADIGEAQVGVLSLVDAHRPEAQSALAPALPEQASSAKRRGSKGKEASHLASRSTALHKSSLRKSSLRKSEPPIWSRLPSPPTRLLPQPVELTTVISAGSTLVLGHTLYTIERLRFEQRLDAVEWWSRPVARDYLRLWLQSETGGMEALVYVERPSGRRFLQAVGD